MCRGQSHIPKKTTLPHALLEEPTDEVTIKGWGAVCLPAYINQICQLEQLKEFGGVAVALPHPRSRDNCTKSTTNNTPVGRCGRLKPSDQVE